MNRCKFFNGASSACMSGQYKSTSKVRTKNGDGYVVSDSAMRRQLCNGEYTECPYFQKATGSIVTSRDEREQIKKAHDRDKSKNEDTKGGGTYLIFIVIVVIGIYLIVK